MCWKLLICSFSSLICMCACVCVLGFEPKRLIENIFMSVEKDSND